MATINPYTSPEFAQAYAQHQANLVDNWYEATVTTQALAHATPKDLEKRIYPLLEYVVGNGVVQQFKK